jgi:O-antigen/teichoic acid export membrane protein
MSSTIDPGTEQSISRKRSTIWNFVFLNVGFFITLCNGLLIIPLYLHYITAPMYGAWLATGNILTWITIIDPGVSGVLLQRVSFYIGERNKEQVGLAITSGILISSVLFFFALLAGYGLSFFMIDIARIDSAYSKDILGSYRIAMWGTALALLADTFRNIILAYQKTRQHGIMLYSVQIAGILLNVILLVMHAGVYALAYSSLFKGFFTLLFAVIYSIILLKQHRTRLRFNGRYFISFSRVFAFTFSSSLFETVANNIDLIFISRYLGSQSVTILDLCRRPVRMMCGLANNITVSMLPSLPHLFGSGNQEKIKITVVRVWNFIFWISGLTIGGFLIYNHSFVSQWVGSRFWIGSLNNVFICLSIFLWTIGYNLSNITLSMGDIRNNSIVTIVRSIAYIAALFLLVRILGMTGAILAFLVPSLIMVVYYPQKLTRATLNSQLRHAVISEARLVALILVPCSVISFLFKASLGWVALAVWSGIYGLLFVALLFMFSPSFKRELHTIISGIKSKLRSGGNRPKSEKQTF